MTISPPSLPVSGCLFQALRDWNATRVRRGKPAVAEVPLLAEILAEALVTGGWCLSDWQDGETLMFARSEFELALAGIVPLNSDGRGPFNADGANPISCNIDRAPV